MNCRKWVLSKFSDNKLLLNQLLLISIKAWLVFFLNPEGLEFVIILLVSSANQIGLDISDIIFGRLLLYKSKILSLAEPHVRMAAIYKNISRNNFLTKCLIK
jgi:hypothetical protein